MGKVWGRSDKKFRFYFYWESTLKYLSPMYLFVYLFVYVCGNAFVLNSVVKSNEKKSIYHGVYVAVRL